MKELFKKNRQLFYYLIISNFFLFFGFRLWQTMFNNFAVEEIGVGPFDIGWIHAIREIPGFLAFTLGFVALLISEVRIMAVSIMLLGAGIFFTGHVYTVPYLILSTILMSIGFHFFSPCNSAIVLMVTKSKETPKALGQLRSMGAASALIGTIVVYLLSGRWNYRQIFMVFGSMLFIGGLLMLFIKGVKENLPLCRKVRLRRKYWLYYLLAFLMGSRRHIFTTFAVFLLVSKFGISIKTTAILFMINSFISIYTLQLVGKLVGHLGERLMLSISFSMLIFVFLGYAYISYLPALFALFIIDNILFGVNLALKTYFKKIVVSREEITSNFSIELAINHISAIIIPITGGIVWEMFGSKAPFLIGVIIVLISLALTQFIKRIPSNSMEPNS